MKDNAAPHSKIKPNEAGKLSLASYGAGYLMSVSLTIIAYLMAVNHVMSKWHLAFVLALFAALQFIVQMVYFLHLGSEVKPRLRLGVFLFMLLVVFILVGGSLWIMYNLNYRMMSPAEINQYMTDQNGGI